MLKHTLLMGSLLALAACGGGDKAAKADSAKEAADATTEPLAAATIDLNDTCSFLTLEELGSVFEGQVFTATQGEVATIEGYNNQSADCVYELTEQGPGKYLSVTLNIGYWGTDKAAKDYFNFVADPGSAISDPLDGLGDQAVYVEEYSLNEVMAVAGPYVISLEVKNPGVDDFDVRTPAIELAKPLGARL